MTAIASALTIIVAMAQRHSAEPFASYNRKYYSPLCLALGAGFLILALNGGTP